MIGQSKVDLGGWGGERGPEWVSVEDHAMAHNGIQWHSMAPDAECNKGEIAHFIDLCVLSSCPLVLLTLNS